MSTDVEMVRGQLAMGAIEAHRALDRLAAAEARAETLAEALRDVMRFVQTGGPLFSRDRLELMEIAAAALAAVTPTEAAEQ